jgi:hypothetical protein
MEMEDNLKANQSIEPTGGSRFCPSALVSQRRLPPVAHARRSRRERNPTVSHTHAGANHRLAAAFILALASSVFGADSEYSNAQAGVRMRVLGYDRQTPTLRIENGGRHSLAIENNISLAVSFYDGDRKLSARRVNNPVDSDRTHEADNIDHIAIIGPGAALEVPLRGVSFDLFREGCSERLNWARGLRLVPLGTHSVRFTSNGLGMTVLNVNRTPFESNFDIPEFTMTVKE